MDDMLPNFGPSSGTTEVITPNSTKFVTSSTAVAGFITKHRPEGTADRQEFGKQFEVAIQKVCWQWLGIKWSDLCAVDPVKARKECPKCHVLVAENKKSMKECSYCHQLWHPECSQLLYHTYPDESEDDYCLSDTINNYVCPTCIKKQMIAYVKSAISVPHREEAEEIARAMLDAGCYGLTPKTMFREISPNHFISAKPDLHMGKAGYIEFKTYPTSDFAITQCKVFAWVLKSPVILFAWNPNTKKIEKTTVQSDEIQIPDLPHDLFTLSCVGQFRIIE